MSFESPQAKERLEIVPTLDSQLENGVEKSIEALIEKRLTQSYGSRLAEYITGIPAEDTEIVERIIEDQKIIRAKYGLPPLESILEPGEHERFLVELADSLGVKIRTKSECGSFFQEYHDVGGVHFSEEDKIGLDIDKRTLNSYFRSLNTLEHELIHALQKARAPRMPIEQMEYEAYVANGNVNVLKEDPNIVEVLFSLLIGGSVNHYYKDLSRVAGEEVDPHWDGAAYFLTQVDKVERGEVLRAIEKLASKNTNSSSVNLNDAVESAV